MTGPTTNTDSRIRLGAKKPMTKSLSERRTGRAINDAHR
jgi:hypothetical protein